MAEQSATAYTVDPHHRRRDVKMIEMAVRKKWKIREELFESLPNQMASIAEDPEAEVRARVSATKAIMAMNEQNEEIGDEPPTPTEHHAHLHLHLSDGERAQRIAELLERARTRRDGFIIDAPAAAEVDTDPGRNDGVAGDGTGPVAS